VDFFLLLLTWAGSKEMEKRGEENGFKGCSISFIFLFSDFISSFAFTPFGDIACKELDVWV